MRGRTVVLSAVLLLLAGQALAAGFRLPEAGAKAQGMGFAFTAQADDPSAIYFNPAGLTQLDGNNAMVGVTWVNETGGKFEGRTPIAAATTEEQKTLDFFIPNAYVTSRVSPDLALGIGVFAPFGLGQEYDDRNASIFRNQVTKVDIRTAVVNPTVAYNVNEFFSIGAGIDYMFGSAKLDQTAFSPALPPPGNGAKVHLEGSGTAWGYNVGMLLKPSKNVKVGASYRSGFDLEFKDADVTVTERIGPFAALPASSKASATLRLPATAALGVSYIPIEKLTLEADLDWTFWSRFKNLTINNKSTAALSSVKQENWKNTTTFRAGMEYRAMKALAVRLGYAWDPTPVPDQTMGPLLPDSNRHNFMLGLGSKLGNVTADASYFLVYKTKREIHNLNAAGAGTGQDGTWYSNKVHVVAFDLGYRF